MIDGLLVMVVVHWIFGMMEVVIRHSSFFLKGWM
jgi:hypothetical protein